MGKFTMTRAFSPTVRRKNKKKGNNKKKKSSTPVKKNKAVDVVSTLQYCPLKATVGTLGAGTPPKGR